MLRLVSFFIGLFVSLALPIPAFAQDGTKIIDCSGDNASLATCKAAGLSIGGSLATVIQFLFVIAVILALGFLIYGGIRWITSGGDKAGVETARNTIIASIIGLIVVFLAYMIINLVLTFLTGKGIGGITIPSLTEGTNGTGLGPDGKCFSDDSPSGVASLPGCTCENARIVTALNGAQTCVRP